MLFYANFCDMKVLLSIVFLFASLATFSQAVINVICRYRGNIVGGKRIMKLIGLDLGKNRSSISMK